MIDCAVDRMKRQEGNYRFDDGSAASNAARTSATARGAIPAQATELCRDLKASRERRNVRGLMNPMWKQEVQARLRLFRV